MSEAQPCGNPVVYADIPRQLSTEDILHVLANVDVSRVSWCAPDTPKTGQMFIYPKTLFTSRAKSRRLRDSFAWKNAGRQPFPRQDPVGHKTYYCLKGVFGESNALTPARRLEIMLLDEKSQFVMVHYLGEPSVEIDRYLHCDNVGGSVVDTTASADIMSNNGISTAVACDADAQHRWRMTPTGDGVCEAAPDSGECSTSFPSTSTAKPMDCGTGIPAPRKDQPEGPFNPLLLPGARTNSHMETFKNQVTGLYDAFVGMTLEERFLALQWVHELVQAMGDHVREQSTMQLALIGLDSVQEAYGIDGSPTDPQLNSSRPASPTILELDNNSAKPTERSVHGISQHEGPDALYRDYISGMGPLHSPEPSRSRLLPSGDTSHVEQLGEAAVGTEPTGCEAGVGTEPTGSTVQNRVADILRGVKPPPKAPTTPTVSCPFCGRNFLEPYSDTNGTFFKHLSTHKKLRCRHCPHSFFDCNIFEKHSLKRHKEKRPYLCCGRRHSRRFYFLHLSTNHLRSGSWICRKCGYTTSDSECAAEHLDSHRAIGLYGCPKCPHVSRDFLEASFHKRKHAALDCHICGLALTRIKDARAHLVFHQNGGKGCKSLKQPLLFPPSRPCLDQSSAALLRLDRKLDRVLHLLLQNTVTTKRSTTLTFRGNKGQNCVAEIGLKEKPANSPDTAPAPSSGSGCADESPPPSASAAAPPAEIALNGLDVSASGLGRGFLTEAELLVVLEQSSGSRSLLAKNLACRLYSEEQRVGRNCAGSRGKRPLSPRRLAWIESTIRTCTPPLPQAAFELEWKKCIQAIDKSSRRLEQRLVLQAATENGGGRWPSPSPPVQPPSPGDELRNVLDILRMQAQQQSSPILRTVEQGTSLLSVSSTITSKPHGLLSTPTSSVSESPKPQADIVAASSEVESCSPSRSFTPGDYWTAPNPAKTINPNRKRPLASTIEYRPRKIACAGTVRLVNPGLLHTLQATEPSGTSRCAFRSMESPDSVASATVGQAFPASITLEGNSVSQPHLPVRYRGSERQLPGDTHDDIVTDDPGAYLDDITLNDVKEELSE